MLVEQGNLPAALTSYQASLAISDRLATADPGNAERQHDLAISLQRIGLCAARQDQHDSALSAYRRGLAIMQRLVKLVPDHPGFNNTLASFVFQIGALGR